MLKKCVNVKEKTIRLLLIPFTKNIYQINHQDDCMYESNIEKAEKAAIIECVRREMAPIHDRAMERKRMLGDYEYHVAFSYASEQENYVEPLAFKLQSQGIRVFYDKFEVPKLWGKDLLECLEEIYTKKAKYCVIFISADYERKLWTIHERKCAQERAFKERKEYILPVRFDDTVVRGIRETIGYIDARKTPIEKLAEIIIKKLSND